MNRTLLFSSVAIVALTMAGPSFAGSGGAGGDDSATITQIGEFGGTASQHQPGNQGNTASITQMNGVNDVATQEQWGNLIGVDYAINGKQTITQTANNSAVANQRDNGGIGGPGDVQTITQTGNGLSGGVQTTALQQINSPLGQSNTQTSTQTNNFGSSVSQLIGLTAPGNTTTGNNNNTQTATQTGQTRSTISQSMNLATAAPLNTGNTQTASEIGGGSLNAITQFQDTGSETNSQVASVNVGSGNTINQSQFANSSLNHQTANITDGSLNFVEQIQQVGAMSDTQLTTVDVSSSGRALQWQGPGVTSASQTITQNGGGLDNQAGQAQANNFNGGGGSFAVATITQTGGAGNTAVQNQGLLSGQSGFMHVVAGVVTRTP